MNISQWKIGDRTFFSLEVENRLLLVQGRTRDGWHDVHFIVSNKYYATKIQEKSESFYIFPEIPCIRSHYLDVRSFRCSDIYNIYSPPKFSRICSYNTYKQQHTSCAAIADVSFGPVVSVTRIYFIFILFLQTWINKHSRTKCTKSRTFNYLIIFINSLRLSRWQSGGGGGGGLGSYDGSQGGKKISSPVCPAEHLKEMWPASLCGVLYYYSTHWITSPSERQCRDRAEKWRASSVLAWPPLQGRSCVNNHPVNTAWLQLELQTGLHDSFSLLKALHP